MPIVEHIHLCVGQKPASSGEHMSGNMMKSYGFFSILLCFCQTGYRADRTRAAVNIDNRFMSSKPQFH